MDTESHQELVANFIDITGADSSTANTMLEATDWVLEEAIQLYFSTQADVPSASASRPGPGGNPNNGKKPPPLPHGYDDDNVRAPIAAKVDRLYGGPQDLGYYRRPPQLNTAPQIADVFRNYKSEGDGRKGPGDGDTLADMFQPPKDLLFPPDLELAKQHASRENKWVLLNLQSTTEFASHMLNRDTWSHPALKELLQGSFIFCQVFDSTDQGSLIMTYYHLARIPSVLVIDPVTGAKVWQRDGFIEAEKMLEALVPFLDHGPNDSGGHMLASANLARKQTTKAPLPTTEDAELELAIAMSMAETNKQATEHMHVDEDDERYWEQLQQEALMHQEQQQHAPVRSAAPAAPAPDPEQLRQAALALVPPEPDESSADACRVAVRFPDGSRLQRRFKRSDSLQAVQQFCRGHLPLQEVGRPFLLLPSFPGAVPLDNMGHSLEQAGAANAMLVVKWQ